MALGIILIIVGLILLLDSLDLLGGLTFSDIWPVLLIAIGLMILVDRVRRSWRRR